MIILSFSLIPIIHYWSIFQSFMKIVVVTSIVNIIILILSIVFADKSKSMLRKVQIGLDFAILPLIILITVIIHILSSLHTFGYIFK